ncbi:MAG TPA: sugar phosphate isomerase/epimerase family protein, partial [bacterium]|nr:sugar phosphate isomerase/epimerase family protein [bacterium]
MRGTWQDAVRSAAAFGYDGVELAVRDASRLDPAVVASIVREAGMSVPAIGTGQAYLADGLSLAHPSEDVRAGASTRVAAAIQLAAQLGAAVIVGLVRGRISGDRAATDRRLLESMCALLPIAERLHVPLLFEPINRYETDYLPTVEAVMEVIQRTGSPLLGVLADTFHMNIEEASIEESLRRAGTRLRHIHVADSNRLAPGWGHLDFTRILSVLRQIDYRGYLSVEILPHPNPHAAARQALEHLRAMF